MSKENKGLQSEVDGVSYRRAKTWQIALSQMNSAASMCFYILMTTASYVANEGYGIVAAIVGLILTGTRIFDAFTDPLIALLIDRTNTSHGKIRLFMFGGWLIEALAAMAIFVWGSGKGLGVVAFVVLYMLYVIGYTMNNVVHQITPAVLTNDPKQRPVVGVWATVYNYLVPMTLSIVTSAVILPMFGNKYTVEMLSTNCMVLLAVSFVLVVLAMVGISGVDKPENFEGVAVKKNDSKVSLKDMGRLIKSNRSMQMYILAATSDKLAQQTGSQAIVSTMLFGILIGNMGMSAIMSAIAMLPGIIFAIIGAKFAGKHGNKEAISVWSKVCIVIAVLSGVFCFTADMRKIFVAIIPTALFFILTLGLNACKMCITTATNAMCADVIDSELDRSGKYIPASVTATYSIIDKLISAFGATIAASCVALIGYTTTLPQPTDSPSFAILVMTVALYYGLPILGWTCSIIAMKFYPLSKGEMVEIQKRIADKKTAMKES